MAALLLAFKLCAWSSIGLSFLALRLSPVLLSRPPCSPLDGQLKVYIAHESSNGDQFTLPLREIKVLERSEVVSRMPSRMVVDT